MMRCTRVEKFLPLHIAGDLAGRRTERRVANHLATCGSCRAVAAEYAASRNLVRAAATLPPDFDGAFYEELRRSVLDEIRRGRTRLAPPTSAGFASLFNARFAYAASLAFVVAAFAALSLHSYIGRESLDVARPDLIANANRECIGTPAVTPAPFSTQAKGDGRQTLSLASETTRETKNAGERSAKSSSPPRRVKHGNAQNATGRSVDLTKHAPDHVQRNSLAPTIAATTANAAESARSSGETEAAHEVSRIEMQTSDPNIRIIWLSPKPDDATAQPLQ
jgi:hypothetical protein